MGFAGAVDLWTVSRVVESAPMPVYLLILGALHICLWISQDHRQRLRIWDATRDLPKDEMYRHFRNAMWILGAYLDKPFRPRVTLRTANRALLVASVLREHMHQGAGEPAPGFLRSRRQLMRTARHWYRSAALA
jgi:hypothetical protein